MQEFGHYILFGACRSEENHFETARVNFMFKNMISGIQLAAKAISFRFTIQYQ